MISILDYGLGNLRSVQKAFERLGFAAEIVTAPGDPADGLLVLPGVGNFADAMSRLLGLALVEPLRAQAASGRPLLGVCLGMQLLFDSSDEDATHAAGTPGLGLIPGCVVGLKGGRDASGRRLKVPQMGWNTLSFRRGPWAQSLERAAQSAGPAVQERTNLPTPGPAVLEEGGGPTRQPAVYFVHGHHAQPEDPSDTLATTEHGGEVVAIAGRGRVLGMQFHPEKSQTVGLELLRAAAVWAGERPQRSEAVEA